MDTEFNCTSHDDLKKLIIENPELPLIFWCGENCTEFSVQTAKGNIENLIAYGGNYFDASNLKEALTEDFTKTHGHIEGLLIDSLVELESEKYKAEPVIVVRLGNKN